MSYERLDTKYKDGAIWDGAAVTRIDDALEWKEIKETAVTTSDYSIVGFMRPAGTSGTTSTFHRTDYIDISAYKTLEIGVYPHTINAVSPVVWYDMSKNYISGMTAETSGYQIITVDVPEGAVYAIFSTRFDGLNNYYVKGTAQIHPAHLISFFSTLADNDDFSITGFMRPAGTAGTSSSYKRTDYISVEGYSSINVHVRTAETSCSPCIWYDSNYEYIKGETATETEETTLTYEVPAGAFYAVFSSRTGITRSVTGVKTMTLTKMLTDLQNNNTSTAKDLASKVYISTTGLDDNDGLTSSTPIATLTKAAEILSPMGELVFMEGDYWNVKPNLSQFAKISTIGNVRFIIYKNKFTEATAVDGYTKIYSTPFSGTFTYKYFWQHDIPDEMTLILDEERHPNHGQRTHRLSSTRIYPVTSFDSASTTTEEYLATIESTTDKYMWYIDETNAILYFSAPNSDFATYPIIQPYNVCLTASEEKKVDISGIQVLYAGILTKKLTGSMTGVKSFFAAGDGGIRWDNTYDMVFHNCEVGACANDGINGHYSGSVVCYDCYAHDCGDDGESAHENCYISQFGGLYEYNGNGCTPAASASGEYFNVWVRNNDAYPWVKDDTGTGFSSQDSARMVCHNCLVDNVKTAYRVTGTSFGTMINCISKNSNTHYSGGTKINCVTLTE